MNEQDIYNTADYELAEIWLKDYLVGNKTPDTDNSPIIIQIDNTGGDINNYTLFNASSLLITKPQYYNKATPISLTGTTYQQILAYTENNPNEYGKVLMVTTNSLQLTQPFA